MVGIQLTGNFGYFNILTAVLCCCGLDTSSSLFDELAADAELASTSLEVILVLGTRCLVVLHSSLSIVFLIFDSWCSTSWAYWPQFVLAKKAWVRRLLATSRLISDLRLLHSYGVFPPASNPPVRMAAVLEGCAEANGGEWKRYEWRYLPSSETSPPCFVAPHHPRLDHSVFYVSFGTSPDNFLATINTARPYALSRASMLHKLAAQVLRGAEGRMPLPLC